MKYPLSVCWWFGISFIYAFTANASDTRDLWLLVDTSSLAVKVMLGEEAVASYDNISLGRGGVSESKRVQDGKTPLGTFHVRRLSFKSKFHIFIGIDYPVIADANRGLDASLISKDEHGRILNAIKRREMPPQNTLLGGSIGLHGIGAGQHQVHQRFNWTQGCIALSNDQIDDLETWVFQGMRVVIK